ncbi:hypothetical protein D3C76_945330 [compost metagenome]
MGDDGLGRAQRIAANTQHRSVPRAQHPGSIGENVRPTFEDERDDAQRRDHLFDFPAVVLDATDHFAAGGRRIAPGAQACDHVAAHALIGQQARGRAATGLGPFDVGQVRGLDQGPALGRLQALREQIEEGADGLVRHRRHHLERRLCTLDRHRCGLLVRHRDQQQLAADLLHQQVVTGLEACRQFGADHSDTVTGERDWRASD